MDDPKFWATIVASAVALFGQHQLFQWRVSKLEDSVKSLYEWKDAHVIDYAEHKALGRSSKEVD